jgi:hypothetical protein
VTWGWIEVEDVIATLGGRLEQAARFAGART